MLGAKTALLMGNNLQSDIDKNTIEWADNFDGSLMVVPREWAERGADESRDIVPLDLAIAAHLLGVVGGGDVGRGAAVAKGLDVDADSRETRQVKGVDLEGADVPGAVGVARQCLGTEPALVPPDGAQDQGIDAVARRDSRRAFCSVAFRLSSGSGRRRPATRGRRWRCGWCPRSSA